MSTWLANFQQNTAALIYFLLSSDLLGGGLFTDPLPKNRKYKNVQIMSLSLGHPYAVKQVLHLM